MQVIEREYLIQASRLFRRLLEGSGKLLIE